jgi:DNA-binding CsgD family transcriptional regulator
VTREQSLLGSALLVTTRLALGEIPAATTAAEPLTVALVVEEEHSSDAATIAHLGLGELAEALGDHPGALVHFVAAGAAGGDDSLRPWRTGAAVALVRTGRRREGAALAREHMDQASDPYAVAIGLRTQAIAEAADRPVELLREARLVAAEIPDLRLRAQIDTDLAALMFLEPMRHGTAEAVALLRGAEEYAGAEGLWPLHSRVVRLLEHLGERARPLQAETLALLTPAEQRVARLAADRMTNRQIAEHLGVSIKGVEWHLSRVYRKLGIGSRTDLGTLLLPSRAG